MQRGRAFRNRMLFLEKDDREPVQGGGGDRNRSKSVLRFLRPEATGIVVAWVRYFS